MYCFGLLLLWVMSAKFIRKDTNEKGNEYDVY